MHTGEDGRPKLSVTKAQMLFWTRLVILLFCVKSLPDGGRWEVPWQPVTLRGMSQATGMVPKLYEPKPSGGRDK